MEKLLAIRQSYGDDTLPTLFALNEGKDYKFMSSSDAQQYFVDHPGTQREVISPSLSTEDPSSLIFWRGRYELWGANTTPVENIEPHHVVSFGTYPHYLLVSDILSEDSYLTEIGSPETPFMMWVNLDNSPGKRRLVHPLSQNLAESLIRFGMKVRS